MHAVASRPNAAANIEALANIAKGKCVSETNSNNRKRSLLLQPEIMNDTADSTYAGFGPDPFALFNLSPGTGESEPDDDLQVVEYTSDLIGPSAVTNATIRAIIEHAQEANARRNITGVLLHNESTKQVFAPLVL